MKRNSIRALVLLLLVFLTNGVLVSANENNINKKEILKDVGASFQVIPKLPAEQKNKKISYFDLMLKPGEKKKIVAIVYNESDKPLKLNIKANNASTSSSGVINYAESFNQIDDKSKDISVEKILKVPNEVEVAANEKKEVEIELEMPLNPFEGTIAGGIEFLYTQKEANNYVQTQFSYVIPIVLRESEKKLTPKIDLDSFNFGVEEYVPSLIISFNNRERVLMKNVEIEVAVKHKSTDKLVLEKKKRNTDIAPESTFRYVIPLKDKTLKPGDYIANVKLMMGKDYKMEWVETFKLPKNYASLFDNDFNTNKRNPHFLIKMGMIVLLIIVMLGSIIFIFNKKKIEVLKIIKKIDKSS